MKQKVDAPNGLRWSVKRLIVPTGMRPLTRTDMLDAGTPRRTVVDGMSREVPDATVAWTGPLPLGLLLMPVVLPYPWGRRYPPVVFTFSIRAARTPAARSGSSWRPWRAAKAHRSSTARRSSHRRATRRRRR